MKKWSLIVLSVIFVVALSVWFSCNPLTQDKTTSYDVLDESGSARLTITCTIAVNGATWNGGGQTIVASGLGDGSQTESQDPIFTITNGTVTNVTIGAPACDGIHFKGGNSTVSSVRVPDIGEDIVSVKGPGTYTVSSSFFDKGEDKCFQINDLCTITVNSTTGSNMGKFCRQNGGKTWKMVMYANSVTANNCSDAVFRSDASGSTFFYRSLTTNSKIAYDSNTHAVAY